MNAADADAPQRVTPVPFASEFTTKDCTLPQDDVEALEAQLADVLDRAELAWPGLRVEPQRFMRYLAARLPSDRSRSSALALLHASDLYVACACASDERAIAMVDAAFLGDCDAAMARMAPSRDFGNEAKQLARTKLFVGDATRPPRITEYSGRGELRAFLRVVVMREALSLRRKEMRGVAVEDFGGVHSSVETTDPELLYLRRTYAASFEQAFASAVRGLTSEERNLLRYHYIERLNIDHIGAICGIHRVTAARRLTSLRATLVERTRQILAERLRITGADLRSVLRLIESHVDISLRRELDAVSVRV